MMNNMYSVVCPSCGAMVATDSNKCEYCGNSFSFVLKKGMYLERKDIEELLVNHFYDQAKSVIQKIDFDSETYVYLAIVYMGGKKPFLQKRSDIDIIVDYLDKALALAANPDAYIVRAYVEFDYFERKHLNRKKDYSYYMNKAHELGITRSRIDIIERMINGKTL